jgi:hypothetical protein
VIADGDVVVDHLAGADLRHLVTTTPDLAWRLLRSLTGHPADHPPRR